ncbi:MAG: hypothetical protein AAF761_12015 [Pseudomonadota bacterium]
MARALFFALAISIWAAPAAARNVFVECVQNQISALGGDPGPVNGLLGPATRRALANVVAARDGLDGLPRLTQRTASTWCRNLAPLAPGLTPADDPAPRIFMQKELTHVREALTRAKRVALAYYADEHGIVPAATFDTILGNDATWVFATLERLRRDAGRRSQLSRSAIDNRCSGGFSAFAGRTAIVICVAPNVYFDPSTSAAWEPYMTQIMVHEVAHHLQRELVADKVEVPRRRGAEPYMGPAWIIEGHAVLLENDWAASQGRWQPRFIQIWTKAHALKTQLRTIRRERRVVGTDYDISHLAVWLLAERYGAERLWDYLRAVGHGATWATAFRDTFDLELTAFEREFESTLRADPAAALNWTEGED